MGKIRRRAFARSGSRLASRGKLRRMSPEPLGPLRVHAAGGSDRRGGGDGPAILLCHGFGAPGDDLVALARVIDVGADVRWFFPEAPLTLPWGGRAWWPLDMERLQALQQRGDPRTLAGETPEGLAPARAALEATIAALEAERGVTRERLLIGGFSQGAMLTTEIALHAERPFAGLVGISGNLLSAERWAEAAPRSGPSLHAFLAHGRQDPVLPFAGAEALRLLLEKAGASVTWVPHGGQHEIPPAVVSGLGAFARQRFSA
jgi:phospholipase/carboxylesterase